MTFSCHSIYNRKEGIIIMTINEKALELHKEWNGKLETVSKSPVKSREALSLAYTPVSQNPAKSSHRIRRQLTHIP